MAFSFDVHYEDDLLTVIDRVLRASDDEIIIGIPSGSRILSSEENFVLLKREADAAGKRIAIETEDVRGRFFAERLGIPLARKGMAEMSKRRFSDIIPPTRSVRGPSVSLQTQKESLPHDSHEPKYPPPREGILPPESEKEVAEEPSAYEPLPIPEVSEVVRRRFRMTLPKHSAEVAVIFAGIVVAFLVANEVLPAVEIRVKPRSEEISFTMPLIVSVEGGNAAVRGQRFIVEAEEERSVPSSGTSTVATKATGTITISNAYSASPQTLVASTRFVSQEGKLFRLVETTVVPGATVVGDKITPSSIEARVIADEPGPEYNIGPSTFSIPGFQGTPKYTAFTAKSSAPMTGGALGNVKVATEDDIARAREGLSEALSEKLSSKFRQEVPQGLTVLEGAFVDTVTLATEPDEAGKPADTVRGRVVGKRTAIAYADADLREAVLQALKDRLPEGTEFLEESLKLEPTVKDRDMEKGRLRLEVSVSAKAAWKIDPEAIRDAVVGKREGEIRGFLAAQEAIESSEVSFTPFWKSSAPEKRNRITVTIEHE
jgi:hypothetical protein